MMFVRPFVCRLSWTGVHCDHPVQFCEDLSLCLDRRIVHCPRTVLSPVLFHFHLEERTRGVWVCKLGKELNTNNDMYK